MATTEEQLDQISDDNESGVKRRKIADREVEYFGPAERIGAALLERAASVSPFIRVGFKSRAF